jgi:hypothetical protein
MSVKEEHGRLMEEQQTKCYIVEQQNRSLLQREMETMEALKEERSMSDEN